MAQNVIINGVTYSTVPEVDIPISGGGIAKFIDTSDATALASDILSSKTAYINGVKITGQIVSKAAETYIPATASQTITAGQYLSGTQTIAGDSNLQSQYIANGITIFGVEGALSTPVISQDGTTKVLSIS